MQSLLLQGAVDGIGRVIVENRVVVARLQSLQPSDPLGVGTHRVVETPLAAIEFRLLDKVLLCDRDRRLLWNDRAVFVRHVPTHAELLQKFRHRIPGPRVVIAVDLQRRIPLAEVIIEMLRGELVAAELLPLSQTRRGKTVWSGGCLAEDLAAPEIDAVRARLAVGAGIALLVWADEDHVVLLCEDLEPAGAESGRLEPEFPRERAFAHVHLAGHAGRRCLDDRQFRAGHLLQMLLKVLRRQLDYLDCVRGDHDFGHRSPVLDQFHFALRGSADGEHHNTG